MYFGVGPLVKNNKQIAGVIVNLGNEKKKGPVINGNLLRYYKRKNK